MSRWGVAEEREALRDDEYRPTHEFALILI